jgi:hypothetical protein
MLIGFFHPQVINTGKEALQWGNEMFLLLD